MSRSADARPDQRLVRDARGPGASRPGMAAAVFALVVASLFAACGNESDGAAATATATATATGDGEVRRVAESGDTVQVHYEGTLDDGEVFDSSRGRAPLTFTVGQHQVIDGFDSAVRGLAVGDSVKVRLEPGEAYGEYREDLVIDVPAEQAPPGLSAGDQVRLQNGAVAVVENVTADAVRIDANHPLAGKALTFEIELVSIQ